MAQLEGKEKGFPWRKKEGKLPGACAGSSLGGVKRQGKEGHGAAGMSPEQAPG